MRQRQCCWWLLLFLALAPVSWAEEEEQETAVPEIEYLPLTPKLVVNLAGRRHYLRADVQLMIKGKDNVERIRQHLPLVRHTLLMLFSDLPPDKVADIDAREKLREEALHRIRKVLDRYSDSDGLKDVFFTEFLVQ
ncbi:MAG TPA: flagellar basal body-associated FliL family protein [Methylothermaceae bacterium]|nr:flagellar basal body-associated FliL family protein [Methylothermaceae bacterium]